MSFDTLHLLVTLQLTLGFCLKVDQNQIVVPMVPKVLYLEKNNCFRPSRI